MVTPTTHEESHISEPRINDRIRVAEVRLVGPNGEQVGIVRVEDALRLAQEADLDLVEVAPDARPPVCKLMDYGKFKYEADMKAREARRNQANTVLKEIRFRLKIDPHDYATKKGHVERFLKVGDKVKVMIMFRGREQSRPEAGVRLLQRLADDVVELGFIESMPKQDGRNMIMVLGPTKKKADAKIEQRRRVQEAESATGEAAAAAVAPAAPRQAPNAQAPDAAAVPPEQVPAAVVAPEPVVAAPEVAEVAVAVPEVAEPVVTEPETVDEPVVAEKAAPATVKPATVEPAAAKPAAAKPAAAKPAVAKPAVAKPAVAKVAKEAAADTTPEPVTVKPAAADPAVVKPAAVTPTPVKPTPAKPAAVKPAPAKPGVRATKPVGPEGAQS
ncbi:translation initiation factor IF-3 [Cellulomonas sp. KRMCY2]|uniref:translation initiation factor IF-3 n=1 Tax=Cellulomonas sp. KRMCY2 TaxID=1304865 RepID=UPI0005598445|nr:translation initiation factor IF-3 [Cellulomonas sp. KRMCY2]